MNKLYRILAEVLADVLTEAPGLNLKLSKVKPIATTPEEADWETLRSWATEEDVDANVGLQVLLDMGYAPVMRGTKAGASPFELGYKPGKFSPQLGAGVYGVTYEVVDKQGQRYAAKVADMGEPTNNNEWKVRSEVEALRETLPEQFAKHIVHCHRIERVESDTGNFYVYIMDMLVPLRGEDSDALYGGLNSLRGRSSIRSFLRYPQKLLVAFQRELRNGGLLSLYWNIPNSKLGAVIERIMERGRRNIDKLEALARDSSVDLASDRLAERIYTELWGDSELELESLLRDEGAAAKRAPMTAKALLIRCIGDALNSEAGAVRRGDVQFTTDARSFITSPEALADLPPGISSFIRAMLYLKERHGIVWDDLHDENVMKNPRTGDFVATDVGMFRMRKGNRKGAKKDKPAEPVDA